MNLSLPECLARAIEETASLHAEDCDLRNPYSPSATVVITRESEHWLEWLVLSDSTLAIDSGAQVDVISDPRVEEVAKACGKDWGGPDEQRTTELLRRIVKRQREVRNSPEGYWVAAENPHAAFESISGRTPIGQLRRAAALTDGAARAVDVLGLADWPKCLDVMSAEGPSAIIEQVREAEHADPNCERWPRSKRHDDATAALLIPD